MVEIKRTHKTVKESYGFTLIELMLAIAIIAVLARIALPTYQNYQQSVKVKSAIVDITMISTQIAMYYQDAEAYPNSLADIGMDGKLDPWGQPYAYLNLMKKGNGGARRDKNLNPLNSDYDLYSMGLDGKSKLPITQKDSLDDVLRANNGQFLNLASNY